MTTATAKGIPVPEETDPPLVPQDLGAVANWLDTNPGVASYSQAEIDGLAASDKWIGRIVYNETTFTHQGWNGTTWLPIGAGVQSFTQAQIDALPASQKSVGMIVWNSGTAQHQAWDGAKWVFVDALPKVANTTAATALGNLPDGTLMWCVNPPQMLRWQTGTWLVESGVAPNSLANLDAYNAAIRVPWGYLGLNTDFSMWEGYVSPGPLWDFAGIPKLTTAQRDALTTTRKRTGCVLWNKDNARHEWWDGTAWRTLNPGTAAGYGAVAQYAIPTGVATSGAGIKAVGSFTFPAVAGRVYEVVGIGPFQITGAEDIANFIVLDGSTTVSSTALTQGANKYGTLPISGRIRTGAAARTVTVQVNIQASFGAGSMNTQANGNIYIYDAGEDGQVSTPANIVPPDMWNGSWGVAAQSAVTTSGSTTQGTTVDMPGSSLTFTPVVGRRYRVAVECNPVVDTAGEVCGVLVRDGSNAIVASASAAPALTNVSMLLYFFTFLTPVAATALTYKISYYRQAGGGSTYLYADPQTVCRLIVEDVGPVNPAAAPNWPPRNPYVQQGYTTVGIGAVTIGQTVTVGSEITLPGAVGTRISVVARAEVSCMNFGGAAAQVSTFTLELSTDGGTTWVASVAHQFMAGPDSGINRSNGSVSIGNGSVVPTGAVKVRLRQQNNSMTGPQTSADVTWTVAPAP